MDDEDKLTIFNILTNIRFCDNIPEQGLKCARMRDVLRILPKAIAKIRNPTSPAIEKIENISDN